MLLNLAVVPIYFTWFLSLKDLLMNSEIMNQFNSVGFLHIENLAVYDPFFLLPFTAAVSTYFMIISTLKENEKMTMGQDPNINQVMQYIKFLPIFSFGFLAFLPAGLNLYFFSLMISNQIVNKGVNKFVEEYYDIPEYFEGTHLETMAKEERLRKELAIFEKDFENKNPEEEEEINDNKNEVNK